MKRLFKQAWPYLVAAVVFAVVALVYMSPELDGKMIGTSDGVQGTSAMQEAINYHKETGRRSFWTGSMFSGMPNYQIGGGEYASDVWMRPLKKVFLAGHHSPLAIVLLYCLGFFVLLRAFRVNHWLAVVGALAIAFSSYFFIIIGACHFSKTSSLALMSMVAAGLYLVFNGHRRLGVALTMLFTALGLYPHPQMAYYMCAMIAFLWLAELVKAWQGRTWRSFGVGTALFAASFLVGWGTGMASTFANMEYAAETMRGGHSDLVKATDATNKTEGLDLDYATAWSYGIGETWTFLIPNYMGGSSNYAVGKDSPLYEGMVGKGVPRRTAEQFCQSVPTYWGEQPFTAGPVYMGAIVCFLFVLGLFLVRGPYKWALLAATLLSVFLSWGHHWMWLTQLFFDLVPMYNKFRAVSSILVIAEVTMPLLGFLALRQLADGAVERRRALRAVYASLAVTGGLCLLMALFGGSWLDFSSSLDERYFGGGNSWLIPLLHDQRQSMFTLDAWRSLLFVVLGAASVWWYVRSECRHTAVFALVLGALVLADMWPVDKRYMNDSMFTSPSDFSASYSIQPYEQQILADKDPHFRVYNLAANPFNDARTSYRFKSIGGYSAAKLRRYQDLIDEHLSQMHWPVINMLNAKYIVVPEDGKPAVARLNDGALGNAWFVDSLVVVDNANAESDALMQYDLSRVAVLDRAFADRAGSLTPGRDSAAVVQLTQYTPDVVEYDAQTSVPSTLVFSEVYYPYGWKASIDGTPADHFRVDYLLRAMNVPAGRHHIRFEFRPDSVARGNVLSVTFVIIMYLTVLTMLVWSLWKHARTSRRAA